MDPWRPLVASWLSSCAYDDRDALLVASEGVSSARGLQFDSFRVFLPPVGSASDHLLLRLRRATQLVGLLLVLDPDAWTLLSSEDGPWAPPFPLSEYDPETLKPKMTFVLHQRYGMQAVDRPTAVGFMRAMLVDCDVVGEPSGFNDAAQFRDAWNALLERDTAGRIARGLRIPIAIQFTPENPATPRQLQKYLDEVIDLIHAVRAKEQAESTYPFQLEEIRLTMYSTHLDAAHSQLKALFSLEIPVTFRLRQGSAKSLLCRSLSSFYLAMARDLSPLELVRADPVIHSLWHRDIFSTFALWSSVAYSSCVKRLVVDQEYLVDPICRLQHAKWLAYALRMNRSLESLVLTMYEPTSDEFRAMKEIALSPDPTRRLYELGIAASQSRFTPKFVSLRADAVIQTIAGQRLLAELGFTTEWLFPAVFEDLHIVHVVVPGHGLCSTNVSYLLHADTHLAVPPISMSSGLKSLVVYSDEERPGVASEFVTLFGPSLRVFSWAADRSLLDEEAKCFDFDLSAILKKLPALEVLALKYHKLSCLKSLWSSGSCLRSLSLENVFVSDMELIILLRAMGDPANSIARSLREFVFNCAANPLGPMVVSVVLEMLQKNKSLQHIHLGIHNDSYNRFREDFDIQRKVLVRSTNLSLRQRLGFISVVESDERQSKLGIWCLGLVFSYFAKASSRKIILSTYPQ